MENSDSCRDRISELPQPLLHHILIFLPQKKSVQTCLLSESWRYLGSTRPNLEFVYCYPYRDSYKKQTFVTVLDKTLHRYHDQKLSIQEFHVEFDTNDPKTVSFLERWFPYLVATIGGVKTFDLSFSWRRNNSAHVDLPLAVFENSKSLRNLRMCGFRFSQNLPMDRVHLMHLQTLTLKDVHIGDEAFQNIMSNCHYIEHVVLNRCEGLTTIQLMNNIHLKRFHLQDFHYDHEYIKMEDLCFVDVPNLESMEFSECGNYWFNIDRHRNMYFPGLKSLELRKLRFSLRPSLDILSRDFPSLQDFKIHDCSGFGDLRVSSHSIKHLTLSYLFSPMKVVVDASNLAKLDYVSSSTLDFSFATTSDECISKMEPFCDVGSEDGFLELHKLLEAVSQSSSKIHLVIPKTTMDDDLHDYDYCTNSDKDDDDGGDCYDDYNGNEDDDNGGDGYAYDDFYDDDGDGGYSIKPVPVEYLILDYEEHGYVYSKKLLNSMFRYCRPRNILERHWYARSRSLCKKLLLKHNRGSSFFWKLDLEEASMELWDKKSEEWHSVEATTFLEFIPPSPDYDYNKHHEVW